MLPLADWPLAQRRAIRGVFTDIDDTLTTAGAITADALQALAELKAAGLMAIAITGRPAGWSEPFAASWPVDAIVAENGAVALLPDRAGLAEGAHATVFVDKRYQQDAATRGVNGARMQQVAARVLREVPGATLAQDSAGRETDIAIDHSEFAHLDAAQIAQVLRILQGEGMSATVSSIHVNAWYGAHNKLEGARWIVRQLLGRELDAQKDDWVFVGDSGNDQLLFEFFDNSVAVANIRHCEEQLQHRPRYVTNRERGAGFAEVATAILTGRGLGPASAAFRHRAPKES